MSGPLKLYDVVMHGVPTRMKLNEDDARRYDATLVGGEPKPATDVKPPEEKADEEAPNKARTSPNKSRAARGKAAPGGD